MRIKWDLTIFARYNIVTVSLFIAIFYIAIMKVTGVGRFEDILIFLIFSDPTVLGFIFIGAIVLFEQDQMILQALVVTPQTKGSYLWSKTIALTLLALPTSLAIAIAGESSELNYLFLITGLVLTSVLFSMIGFIAVVRVKSFNQYIFVIPIFLAPTCLPLLNFLHITDSYLLYLIPTQGSLILLTGTFRYVSPIETLYAVTYLLISCFVAYKIALREFDKYLTGNSSTHQKARI